MSLERYNEQVARGKRMLDDKAAVARAIIEGMGYNSQGIADSILKRWFPVFMEGYCNQRDMVQTLTDSALTVDVSDQYHTTITDYINDDGKTVYPLLTKEHDVIHANPLLKKLAEDEDEDRAIDEPLYECVFLAQDIESDDCAHVAVLHGRFAVKLIEPELEQ